MIIIMMLCSESFRSKAMILRLTWDGDLGVSPPTISVTDAPPTYIHTNQYTFRDFSPASTLYGENEWKDFQNVGCVQLGVNSLPLFLRRRWKFKSLQRTSNFTSERNNFLKNHWEHSRQFQNLGCIGVELSKYGTRFECSRLSNRPTYIFALQ